MGALTDASNAVQKLNRQLRETRDLLPGGGIGAPRGASVSDIRGLRGEIRNLGRQVSGIGGGQVDPFLKDLTRGTGPKRA